MSFDLVVAGVGGQGSILLSHIVADAAIRCDSSTRVRVGETFGAAMRGGSVASHVRIGKDVYGPLVGKAGADVVLAMEPLEGLRVSIDFLKRGGVAILNTRPWYPVDVNIGVCKYPEVEAIEEGLSGLGADAYLLDATEVAIEAGHAKAANVVMLGALSSLGTLPVDEECLLAAVRDRVPQKALDVNLKAFELGKKAMKELMDTKKLGKTADCTGVN
ncbi:MAG TPA: indolepyruvate ferredoxin oxidoreductase subunit beta [Bacillota bacterium]|nr:indolepyruvate ferredoxin oxidoreductase subunit beta [Bacillota bacterium]